MIYGYVRPLYNDVTCKQQLASLGSRTQNIFQESHGSSKKRTELESLLMNLKKGDIIVVERMFVLADTTRHLVDLLKLGERDGVVIQFIHEGIQSDEVLNLSLRVYMQYLMDFQTDIVKQTTTIGIENAKEQGKTLGRPKKPDTNIKKAIAMYHSGDFTLHEIKEETGISKSTLYRYLESAE